MKKWVKKHKIDVTVFCASILVLIVGAMVLNILASIFLFLLINGLYFGKDLYSIFKKRNKKTFKSKRSIQESKFNKKLIASKKNDEVHNKKPNKTKKKKRKKRIIIFIILTLFSLFVIAIACIIGFFYYIVVNAPEFNPDALYSTEPTIIYDKNGNEIDRIGIQQRVVLEYQEIPEVLINAIVATEDSQFFQHNGVDIKRFLAASFQQVRGVDAGGASTLTMQLSKKTYTNNVATGFEGIVRKFTDVYLAVFKIESTYTKEDILTFYINSNYLGAGGYGVEQTARTYFNKSAKDLNLSEAAMIAGLFQAPGKYNPYTNPEATEKRRQTVLKLMLRHGYIDKTEYDIAMEMTVDKILRTKEEQIDEITEYQSFIDQVTAEVIEKTGKDPSVESMQIYTTMDPEKQSYITKIMNNEEYQPGVRFNWVNEHAKAGIAVVDVHTGAVVALGGGRNITTRKSLNYATQIRRQIGSTAKPLFDYGPEIEYNNWNTYSIVVDEPMSYGDGRSLSNWDGGYQGFETMRRALSESRNIPALKAFRGNTQSNIITFVTNLGLHPEVENGRIHEAHAIGGYSGESALTMASAYAAFANKGYYTSPYTFTKIEFADGTVYDNVPTKVKVMSEETAFMMTSMLIDTAQHALGRWANINNQQYAAKTGTTNYPDELLAPYGLQYLGVVKDIWAIGYNTDYAIGVWYGYDEFDPNIIETIASTEHTRLFQAVGQGIFNNNQAFEQPEGVTAVTLEYGCPTACLPSAYTPDGYKTTELFVSGTEPTTVSERFDKLQAVSSLKASGSGSTVTLTWNAVTKPKALDYNSLKEYYRPAFINEGSLDSYTTQKIQENQSMFGQFGYNVYVQTSSGLKLLGFTTENKYVINNQYGNNTYVVKTAYSSFGSNMSDGKSVSIKLAEKSSQVIANENKEEFIKQLFKSCLNTNANNTDVSNWISYKSASSIAQGICGTKKYDNMDDDLKALYNGILGRDYTESEYTSIKTVYEKSRTDALKQIINSQEFKTYCSNKGLTY